MNSAVSGSVGVVAYLALFAAVGLLFVFVNLLIGRLLRPRDPHPEKLDIYECGEPTIGSSFVQFDLRFYVVALIFIVFDVEVAFLFPWATVFGKADHLSRLDPQVAAVSAAEATAQGLYTELGLRPQEPAAVPIASAARGGQLLRWLSAVEVLVFFLILLVGYVYVWGTGALDWVRTVDLEATSEAGRTGDTFGPLPREAVMTV